MLKEYGNLLEEYKKLKIAHEEKGVSNGVEKASNAEAQNPYALVLVDGNGYIVCRSWFFRGLYRLTLQVQR